MYAAKQQQELQSAHRVVRGEDIHDVAARDELVLHRTVAGPDEHRGKELEEHHAAGHGDGGDCHALCRCIEQPGAHGVRNRRGDDRHVLCPLRAVPVAKLVGRRRIRIPVRSAVTVALLPETGPLSHRSNRQRRRSAPELRLHLLAAEPDDLPHDPNLLSWCRRLPAGPGRDTPINSARWRHAMSIFALAISSGSSNLAFSSICAKRAAAQGNGSVELLLPEGGGRL